MNQRFLFILFLLIQLIHPPVHGQQLAQFTQYAFNTISVNPAYAGAREVFIVNFLNRNQWVGVNGAPETQTLSLNTSITNSKFGVGLSVINDKLGFEKTIFAYADVSYTIDLGYYETSKLSFGLKIGASKYDLEDGIFEDPNNQNDAFLNNFNSKWNPNFGVGLYYRTDNLYLGLSVPKVVDLSNDRFSEFNTIDRLNYYFNGGYLLEINPRLKIKPSFLVKYLNGAPLAVDLNSFFILFEDRLWLGANYRIGDAVGALARFNITDGLNIGYAYDFTTSNLSRFSSGSHEILLTYEFKIPARKCRCPDLYN